MKVLVSDKGITLKGMPESMVVALLKRLADGDRDRMTILKKSMMGPYTSGWGDKALVDELFTTTITAIADYHKSVGE